MFSKQVFVLFVGCVVCVLAAPKRKIACKLDDLACTSLTADPLFRNVMKGRPDLNVPGSEPLHVVEISGRLDDMNYNLTNAELYGISECRVKKHGINILQLSWSLLLHCPKLVLKSNYEFSGSIRDTPIEGKGECKIEHEKYRIGMRGGFDFVIDSKGRPHMRVSRFDIDRLELVGNVRSEFSNLYNGDLARSAVTQKFLNDNWKTIGFHTQSPTMHSFMKNMFDNINVYLRVVPANELFYREE